MSNLGACGGNLGKAVSTTSPDGDVDGFPDVLQFVASDGLTAGVRDFALLGGVKTGNTRGDGAIQISNYIDGVTNVASGAGALLIGNGNITASGRNAIAIATDGDDAASFCFATGDETIAIGNRVNAPGDQTTLVGHLTNGAGAGTRKTAFGYSANAGTGVSDGSAFGANSDASGTASTSLGSSSAATGTGGVGVGANSESNGNGSFAGGGGSTTGATAMASGALALVGNNGTDAAAFCDGANSAAIGSGVSIDDAECWQIRGHNLYPAAAAVTNWDLLAGGQGPASPVLDADNAAETSSHTFPTGTKFHPSAFWVINTGGTWDDALFTLDVGISGDTTKYLDNQLIFPATAVTEDAQYFEAPTLDQLQGVGDLVINVNTVEGGGAVSAPKFRVFFEGIYRGTE